MANDRCGGICTTVAYTILAAYCAALVLITIAVCAVLMIPTGTPGFRVESFSVSNLNLSDNQISGDWTLRLGAKNPNRLASIVYHITKVDVFYSGAGQPNQLIASNGSRNHFSQKQKQYNTVLDVNLMSWRVGLSGEVAELMIRDGVIQADVHVKVDLQYLAVFGKIAGHWPVITVDHWDVAFDGIKLGIVPPITNNATALATEIPRVTFTDLNCHSLKCFFSL